MWPRAEDRYPVRRAKRPHRQSWRDDRCQPSSNPRISKQAQLYNTTLPDARQHGLAHDTDRRQPLLGRAVVSGGNDNDELEVGEDPEPLPAIAEAADPMLQPYSPAGKELHVAEVPLIAVARQFIHADTRREACGEPIRRHDLTAAGH